ncbi:MBL fold metallo-hydrolase [Geoglobus acetivorans]|uniref:Beta-lactamase domain protein n=1 Tax=Geoglobus acetivorans TaxID=565033 RepID=A0A0A7GC60_GEOAI|nr:beta-lactamase domain protein [Geoglobus acetivorans]
MIRKLNLKGCNCYLIVDSGKTYLVDTGTPGNLKRAKKSIRNLDGIILTHAHYDHAGSAFEISEHFSCEVYSHVAEHPYLEGREEFRFSGFVGRMIKRLESLRPMKWIQAEDIEKLRLREFDVVHVPGHTPGSIMLLKGNEAIVGDLIRLRKKRFMAGEYVVRPSSRNFNWNQSEYVKSLGRLGNLAPLKVHPGHGVSITLERDFMERLGVWRK